MPTNPTLGAVCSTKSWQRARQSAHPRALWRAEHGGSSSSAMSVQLLVGCFEVPGWGGAATFSYTLFDRMQQEGRSVAYVNLVADDDAAMLRDLFGGAVGNPRSLADVHTCVLERPLFRVQAGLAE